MMVNNYDFAWGCWSMTNIGLLIRMKREELGLTQQELADKLGYKNKASIQKIETCRDIPLKKLRPIADVLGIDIALLLKSRIDPQNEGELLAEAYKDPVTMEIIKTVSGMSEEKKKVLLDLIKTFSIT